MLNRLYAPLTLCKNHNIFVSKRFMMRNVSQIVLKPCTVMPQIPFNHTIKRHLPDHGYTILKVKNKITGKDPKTGHNNYEGEVVTSTGNSLPQHENSHAIVRDNETGKDVGILTSAKNPQKGNIKVASENYKGEILPNGQPKAQQFRAFQTPRYSKNAKNMEVDVQATAFAQKYDKELNNAVKQAKTHNKPAILRVDKNSSILYHPDGKPIFDHNGKEIDYDN